MHKRCGLAVWWRTQPLAVVSHLSGSFDRNKITRAPFAELKEPPLFAALWILDPNSGPSVLQNSPIVRVEQDVFHAERNRYLRRKEFL